MRSALLGCLCAAGLLLAACGSSTTQTQTVTSVATVTQSPNPPTTTATSTPTTATTSTVSGPGPCVAADLALSYLGQQGAAGHGLIGFALRNSSNQSCRTFGYPGVLFLSKTSQPLPTSATRVTRDIAGPVPATPLVLAPGSTASFRLVVTHGMSSTTGCSTAYGLQVIAPSDTATLRTQIPGGAYECRTATLSPLRPGNSAYP